MAGCDCADGGEADYLRDQLPENTMRCTTKSRTLLFSVAGGFFITALTTASDLPQPTPVEHESQWWPMPRQRRLGSSIGPAPAGATQDKD
jgi:hypothetical protein